MQVVRDRRSLRRARLTLPGPIGFVPTMGALHQGHLSLIAAARDRDRSVVASLFLNPRQFGPAEDLGRYPRDEATDLALFQAAGVDLVFAPDAEAVYPPGFGTTVHVGVGDRLEGAARPAHFDGVATVVTILLSLVAPDRAYFGQKDGQQTVVVRRLVTDLGLPVEILVRPTVREPDGLAMSSRNRYLSAEERRAAPALYRALRRAAAAYDRGEHDGDRLRSLMREALEEEPLLRVDYVSVAHPETLEELEQTAAEGALASVAARLPSVRLIDSLVLGSILREDRPGTAA